MLSEEYLFLIKNRKQCEKQFFESASAVLRQIYGDTIYVRGLIEFSNYCRNDCYYCGIRRSNKSVRRYRLSEKEILECADYGYNLGFRTFVLQGGEDTFFTDERLCRIIRKLKVRHEDCAVTLSLGYQVGAGFMVGSPFQTPKHLSNELVFLKKLNPHMVGIGPFIPHKDTPFAEESQGSAELTLFMLALIRLTLPNVLLPATTALATADPFGHEKGILAGANVIMPNLSPLNAREKYTLYDNKIYTGDEAAQNIDHLRKK